MSAEQTTIAVGYVRVASGSARKREDAVYLQRQAILRYAKINGIRIPRFFSDHACISDIAMRQGLSDAMEYIAKRKASAVIVAEPIIKKSIQTALLGMMTKSIQQEISPQPASTTATPPTPEPVQARPADKSLTTTPADPTAARAPAPKPVLAQPPEPIASTKDGAIVTTEEELEIFRVVSRLCGMSAAKAPIKYKDGTNFFAINLGPVRTWFLRLFAGSRRKSFVARLPIAQTEPLARGFQVEAIPDNPDKSRIYFASIADVEKLQPLILRAYEDAVRRQASGGSEGDDGSE